MKNKITKDLHIKKLLEKAKEIQWVYFIFWFDKLKQKNKGDWGLCDWLNS